MPALHTPPILSSLRPWPGSPVGRPQGVQKVVDDHGDGGDDDLRDRAVDSGQNVDAVGGKCGNGACRLNIEDLIIVKIE